MSEAILDQIELSSGGVDRHGDYNLLLVDNWANVALAAVSRRKAELKGSNLNTLLIALFQLFGSAKLYDADFPGGVTCWEDSLDCVFLCLLENCSLEEVLFRIFTTLQNYAHYLSIQAGQKDKTNTSMTQFLQYLQVLSNGSVAFLFFWLQHISGYLSESDLLQLRSFCQSLFDFLQFHKAKSSSQSSFLKKFTSSTSSAQTTAALLQQLLSEKSALRLTTLLQLLTQRLQQLDQLRCNNNFYSLADMRNPNLPVQEGKWNGLQVQERKDQLKASLASTPQLKLEIFGGDMLIDMSDDDEDADSGNKAAVTQNIAQSNSRPQAALPRIPIGMKVLNNPSISSKHILDLDMQEVARQWTLVDHLLFQNISLRQLLRTCFSINAHLYQGIYSDSKFLDSIQFGDIKRFVDRFNAASMWVTSTILQAETVEQRAGRISKFIQLAVELQKLGNYHGLMAILTSLQQGCVNRLQRSFELVAKSDINQFSKLKKLMAAGKNYASYREEIQRLMLQLPLERIDANADAKKDVSMRYNNAESKSDQPIEPLPPLDNIDLDFDHDLEGNAKVEAIVPHLAAHVAALTAVAECHGDYLSEQVHLFNIVKWRLCTATIKPLERLQKLQYPFQPIRAIITALHCAWKPHFHRTMQASADAAKVLFMLSETRESAGDAQNTQTQPGGSAKLAPAASTYKPQHTPYVSKAAPAAGDTQVDTAANKVKFQKSDAYDRIRRSSVGHVGPIKKVDSPERAPSTFKRMFSSMYVKPSKKAESDSDEEEEDDEEEEEEEESEEEEEEDDEEEEDEEDEDSEAGSAKPKAKSTFKGLLKAVSFMKR